MSTAIKVENLGKKYMIQHEKTESYSTLRDTLANGSKSLISRIINKNRSAQATQEEFWALKDIDFEIKQGDKVGIIGRNGAGKSTLLKVLSRITEPTTGKIHINGRIASLLEVGTGFHPELTGRENIYLNGAILGMSRKEIKSKFDEIVAFSEVEKFLDTPVKRYSSGMYVRLAFSVAAHLEPEILVVDEVLAVGDVEFQKKCLGKMGEVSKEGRTILFVSHNMSAISSLCNRGILLESGNSTYFDTAKQAIQIYMQPNKNLVLTEKLFSGPLKRDTIFQTVSINNNNGSGITINPNSEIIIEVTGESKKIFNNFRMALSIYKNDIRVLTTRDVQKGTKLDKGVFIFKIKIPKYLLRPGIYSVAIGGRSSVYSDWINGTQLCDFIIKEKWDNHNEEENEGIINIPFNGERLST